MPANDYSEFKDATPGEETFAALNALVDAIREKEAECEMAATVLAKRQEELRVLSGVQLPNLMDELQLKEFTTVRGLKIELDEKIECGISEDRKPVAFRWLENNGHAGMIKRQVGVQFNKGQEAEAKQLVEELTGKFAAVTENRTVHPSTLKAWVKEMLREGKNFPLEHFGVFRRKVAKITDVAAKKK